jgi:methylated-DNA-protein-cysteine methyltransferase-like protein
VRAAVRTFATRPGATTTRPTEPALSFNEQVYALVRRVPRGRVITYGAVARCLGQPAAARQVGWAMHQCPHSVPAHRVINRLGAVSGDQQGGAARRRARLEAEGLVFDEHGRCDLAVYEWAPVGCGTQHA